VLTVSSRETSRLPRASSFKESSIVPRRPLPSSQRETVFVGDTVADAKVKAIDQSSVTLDLSAARPRC
jgi:hypothetical protein